MCMSESNVGELSGSSDIVGNKKRVLVYVMCSLVLLLL